MMSTTHLRIGLLNSVSLGKSSLVRTKLRSILGHITYSLLSELVHLLLSVITSSLLYDTPLTIQTFRISIKCFSYGRSPATSLTSSRTAFTLFEACYKSQTNDNNDSEVNVTRDFLQLLGLVTLLTTCSNTFPRTLH